MPASTHKFAKGQTVTAKSGNAYLIQGLRSDNHRMLKGEIGYDVIQIKNGKKYGPFRLMRESAFATEPAKPAPSVKTAAKAPRKGTLSVKLAAAETPERKEVHEANIAFARKVAKAAKPATGAKAKILDMIAAKGGTSAAEVCKALGWVRAGATIGRAIKLATFKVGKRNDDGVLRYYRVA